MKENVTSTNVVANQISNTCKIIVLAIIMVFALIGNIFLVTSLIKIKRMRKSMTSMLILNLACCDILIVTTSISGEIAEFSLGYFTFGEIGCRILYPLSTFGIISAVANLMIISLDRYIATIYPFRYRWLKSRGRYALLLGHFISFCCVIPYMLNLSLKHREGGLECRESWSTKSSAVYTVFLFFIEYAIPLSIMISLYTRSWIRIKQQNDDIIRDAEHRPRHNNPLDENEVFKARLELIKKYESRQKQNNVKKIMRTMTNKFQPHKFSSQISVIRHNQTVHMLKLFICIVLVFAICMLPYQIIWLYDIVGNNVANDTGLTVAYWLTYANSVLNPIIYGLHPKFRKVYFKNFIDIFNACVQIYTRNPNKRRRLSSVVSKSMSVSETYNFTMSPEMPRVRRSVTNKRFQPDIIDGDLSYKYNLDVYDTSGSSSNTSSVHKMSQTLLTHNNNDNNNDCNHNNNHSVKKSVAIATEPNTESASVSDESKSISSELNKMDLVKRTSTGVCLDKNNLYILYILSETDC